MAIHFVLLPVLITFVPWVLTRFVFATSYSKRFSYRQSAPYLWAAAILWEVGLFLPEVSINGQTETFAQHFAGGVVAAILFYFFASAYGIRFARWWQKPLTLYFFVSGLGVANELLELLTDITGLVVDPVHRNDTWWDLLANTVGAGIAFACAELYRRTRAKTDG